MVLIQVNGVPFVILVSSFYLWIQTSATSWYGNLYPFIKTQETRVFEVQHCKDDVRHTEVIISQPRLVIVLQCWFGVSLGARVV